jgi:hypothetical protein
MMPALQRRRVVADRPDPTEYFIENDRREQGDSAERKLLKIKEIRIVCRALYLHMCTLFNNIKKTVDMGSGNVGRMTDEDSFRAEPNEGGRRAL